MIDYTNEEKKIIEDAYFQLERIVETDYSAEECLIKAITKEKKTRLSTTNARVLIIRAIYNCNNIKKHEIFSYSLSIANCIIMGLYLFHNPYPELKQKIIKFKKLAKLAIKAHDNYMQRKFEELHNATPSN